VDKGRSRLPHTVDRLRPLRAFCQVARLGSVSRAAEALSLSQPAVTLQLQAVERAFGADLFERLGRRWTLTQAGSALYQLARPLVEGLDGIEGEFQSRRKALEGGELHVAAGSSTILYLLPRLVRAFRESHPDTQLVLHDVTGKDGLGLLRGDGVDLAVGSMPDVPSDMSYAPVYSSEPMLIMAKGHPLASKDRIRLEDLSPYGLILPPKRLSTWRMVDLVFQQRRVPYTVALEVGGWEIIKQYVAMGLGISIVAGICIGAGDREQLEVRDVGEFFPARTYGVVTRKGKLLSPQARAFADLVKPGVFGRHAST
jgi:DNA-binding transcriptional LysR family regulator